MQVLARMFPEANDCFLFVPGDLETLNFGGDIPSNIFSLWVVSFLLLRLRSLSLIRFTHTVVGCGMSGHPLPNAWRMIDAWPLGNF